MPKPVVRTIAILASCAMALAISVTAPQAQAKAKKGYVDIAQCPPLQALNAGEVGRATPITVPRLNKPYNRVVVATTDRLAVLSNGGQTLCIDMRLRGEVTNFAMSPEGRFFTFDWAGYEADGHVIIDRSGTGQIIDTGGKPSLSPSRQRIGAVHQSEAAFSELEGLGIWQINPVGMQQIGLVSNIPELADWRIDAWTNEDCIDMSGVPFARVAENNGDVSKAARDRYIAKPYGNTWRVVRTTLGCAGGG
jgi:hypothetical protein